MNSLAPESLLIVSLLIALVPLLLVIGTCYLKFSIVLSLLKSGFGTQQAPTSAVVMALSTALSILVMGPVLDETFRIARAVKLPEPSKITLDAVTRLWTEVSDPWQQFLRKHAGEREREVFSHIAYPAPQENEQHKLQGSESLGVILSAFVVTEIKAGFLIALILLMPFLVIDLVVANVLVGMSLTMMSPVVISLPLKILLFVYADGWLMMTESLVRAYE